MSAVRRLLAVPMHLAIQAEGIGVPVGDFSEPFVEIDYVKVYAPA